MSAEPASARAGRLRASVVMLRALLQAAAKDLDEVTATADLSSVLSLGEWRALKDAAAPLRVVVALDEVMDSAAWGSEWAFPAWRQLIEDPSIEASWLFSSTKPLASATNYSPLGNAMREYNLGPLHDHETDQLVRALEDRQWLDGRNDKWAERPTVTYYARRLIGRLAGHQPYILQVLCCHLFEECTRDEVPIITTRLVDKIVRKRVLPELADYFASQWSTISVDHGDAIKAAVRERASDLTMEPWTAARTYQAATYKFRPEVQKAVERAGVGSVRLPTVLVPLFAKWVQEHFGLTPSDKGATVQT